MLTLTNKDFQYAPGYPSNEPPPAGSEIYFYQDDSGRGYMIKFPDGRVYNAGTYPFEEWKTKYPNWVQPEIQQANQVKVDDRLGAPTTGAVAQTRQMDAVSHPATLATATSQTFGQTSQSQVPQNIVPPEQISEQAGQRWTRLGQGVFFVNADGSLGEHLSEQDYITTWASKGLRLENIPQYTGISGVTGFSTNDLNAKLQAWGIDASKLSPEQVAVFGGLVTHNEAQAQVNNPQPVDNALDFGRYYDEALKGLDPEYRFQAELGKDLFIHTVARYTDDTQFAVQQEAQKQQNDRTALAEAEASKGRAFSGFREAARNQLTTQQGGIIESNRRKLQGDVAQLGSEYEQKYGSLATPNLNVMGIQYNPSGGISGSLVDQQRAQARQIALQNAGLLPYAQAQGEQTQQIINPTT